MINAQINQIISLYETLGKDIEPNFVEDVIKEIKKDKKAIEENPYSEGGDDKDEDEDEEDSSSVKKKDDLEISLLVDLKGIHNVFLVKWRCRGHHPTAMRYMHLKK